MADASVTRGKPQPAIRQTVRQWAFVAGAYLAACAALLGAGLGGLEGTLLASGSLVGLGILLGLGWKLPARPLALHASEPEIRPLAAPGQQSQRRAS